MPKSVEDIRNLISELKKDHSRRVQKCEAMRDAYRRRAEDIPLYITDRDGNLQPMKAFVSPWPTNAINTGVEILTANPIQINVPPRSETKPHKDQAQKTEDFLLGCWRQVNREAGRILYADAIFHMLLYGQCVVQVLPVKDRLKEGKFPFVVRIISPDLCLPQFEGNELVGIAFAGEFSVDYVRRRWKAKLPDHKDPLEMVEWIEWWDEDQRAYFAGDELVRGPEEHGLGYLNTIWGWGRATPLPLAEDQGQSLIEPGLLMWHYSNITGTIKATSALLYANDAMIVYDPEGVFKGGTINLKPGFVNVLSGPGLRAEWLQRGRNPVDIDILGATADRHLELTSWPQVIAGVSPGPETAAAAINLLTHAGMLRSKTYQANVEFLLERVNELFLRGVEYLDTEIELPATRTTDGEGLYSLMKYGPKDVRKYYLNEVRVVPEMPQDKASQTQIAVALTQGPDPIVDKETVRDKILQIQDPGRIARRIDQEKVRLLIREIISQGAAQAVAQELQAAMQPPAPPGGIPPEALPQMQAMMGPQPGGMGPMAAPPAPGGSIEGQPSPGPNMPEGLPPLIGGP